MTSNDRVEARGAAQSGPTTSTISTAVQFRGGCVRRHPQVFDFTITAVVNAPIRTEGAEAGMGPDSDVMQSLLQRVAAMLGHRMLWWDQDDDQLRRPVVWPTGVAGPRLPLLRWQVRPTAENVAMWIAGWLIAQIDSISPDSALVAVELRESPSVAAVVRGVDIADCNGFPGLRP
ncbi:6-carboxytetrahydropterin synthase [Rhodococcus sp. NCIMB 12038]|uniref:6-carboxytetrahydropterin synthase n=1 Tax=Rhodococcus sp. NCIMB 12038 TaxID=933800 RepID=UPI000B3C6026|nr:6-carboxytetrahydropterin synthase [Rhodococcus sp. NCIMB 12038]OUS97439.1 hypothetical protein CA951_03600 [Rhodococcus sp. NCIMB 12038]